MTEKESEWPTLVFLLPYAHWRQKGGFLKGWFWRMYPRSGFRSGGTCERTLVPVFRSRGTSECTLVPVLVFRGSSAKTTL